jgi:hypothetical protein
MSSQGNIRIAHVDLFTTSGNSYITVTYTNVKSISIFISTIANPQGRVLIKHALIQDFVDLIDGHVIPAVNASSDVPREILRTFISLCQQNETYSRIRSLRGPSALTSSEAPRETDILRQIMVNTAYGLDRFRRQYTERITDELLDEARTQIRQLTTPQIPVHVDPSEFHRDSVSHVEHVDLQPVEQPSPPQRFVEHSRGIPRSIIVTSPESKDRIEQKSEQKLEQKTTPSLMERVDIHAAVERTVPAGPIEPILVPNIQSTDRVRNAVTSETIARLAQHIYTLMVTGKTRNPNFTDVTKTGYRKIKNYIHNITHVWLSHQEIDAFIVELNKISTISSDTTHTEQE